MPDLNAFNLLDEPVADRLQSFWGPRMEPVNSCALDESWKSSGPNTKGSAHGRETQYHLQRSEQTDKESAKYTYCIQTDPYKSPYLNITRYAAKCT